MTSDWFETRQFQFTDECWQQLENCVRRAGGDLQRFEKGRPRLEWIIDQWGPELKPLWEATASTAARELAAAKIGARAIDDLQGAMDQIHHWRVSKRELDHLRRKLKGLQAHMLQISRSPEHKRMASPRTMERRNVLWLTIGGFWVEYMRLNLAAGNPSPSCDFNLAASGEVLSKREVNVSIEAIRNHVRSHLKGLYGQFEPGIVSYHEDDE